MKTKFFDFFRAIFRVPFLEKVLRRFVHNKDAHSFISKLVPNNYQYPKNSTREFQYNGVNLKLDIHDYVGHYLYFGFKDAEHQKLMSLVKKDDVVIDIGTNCGTSILQFAKIIGNGGQTFSFELDDNNLKQQNSSAKELIHFLTQMNYHIQHSENGNVVLQTDNFTNCHYDIICK